MKWLLLLLIIILVIYFRKKRREKNNIPQKGNNIPEEEVLHILKTRVAFFQQCSPAEQEDFLKRVMLFLSKIKITPVNHAGVSNTDRVYVAAAGIIPLFRFKGWFYNNLDEVLIYPDLFTENYDQHASKRYVAGMVGTGAMHRMMILSLPQLRQGFEHQGKSNTAIHEFVHLVDKADGATDGVPEYLFDRQESAAWIRLMHQTISEMREGNTDINPYGATNEAEFFAVASEYFFSKPEQLRENHPELFALLEQAFKQGG